ncbi:MAG: hypothetical protein JXB30_09980, partial [Anaerolineae bacterium]|nr:hypothetical protein [Anaerolineae bacterium]
MSAEYEVHAWALLHDFRPYCPRAKLRNPYLSPFHQLNGFVYHDNRLQNFLVATSISANLRASYCSTIRFQPRELRVIPAFAGMTVAVAKRMILG